MLIKVLYCNFFQQDFKNDKDYLSADMRQMLLTGKVRSAINPLFCVFGVCSELKG